MSLKSLPIFPLLFFITYLILGLCINLVQVVLLCTTNKHLFRKLNYYLMYGIYGYLLALGDWWSAGRINIYGADDLLEKMKKKEVDEHALILMNHHTELDWLYTWMIGDRLNVLGNCRAFAKDSLRYVPIVGWAWAMSDMVFLKRDWEKDQETMMNTINNLLTYPSPTWLLLFPEGTRFTAEKHQASLQFSSQQGLPRLDHHLTPRTRGFSFLVENVDRNKLMTVYDVTLVKGEEKTPFNLTSVLGGIPTTGNVYIRSIPIDNIPKDKEKSTAWLHSMFKEKDDLKHNFLTTGNFVQGCSFITLPRGLSSLVLLVSTNMLVHIPLLYTVMVGGWIMKLIVLLLGGVAMAAIKTIRDTTSISKSSSYGTKID